MRPPSSRPRLRAGLAAGALGLAAAATSFALPVSAATAAQTSSRTPTSVAIVSPHTVSGGNLPAGAIKHVWTIIEENKSYDATFTGLNKNSYLWQTLPSQGVLLKNYYGTGHSSQDNYLALAAGQAPEEDVQQDCSVQNYDFGSNASTVATSASDVNFGQTASAAGANHTNGQNGCTYPTAAPTLFNQLDAAGKTWKGYAQDLGGASANSPTAAPNGTGTVDLRPADGANAHTASAANGNTTSDTQDRDSSACGGFGATTNFPGAANTSGTASTTGSTSANSPSSYGVTSFTGAQADDQYVAKHFPFPWFHSLIGATSASGAGITTPTQGGTDCDSAHIANLDSATTGLAHDLASEATTPNFSWISPNNCSDAHDAVCKGNNLSGAFNSDGTPNYNTTPQAYDPESTTPTNYTGGLYASDLFLKYYIPLIEQSAAFKDGGLIDVTFDEANPPFTYSGNSFNNAKTSTATSPLASSPDDAPSFGSTGATVPGASSVYGAYGVLADAAGQNINGANQNSEPTGPNSTLSTDANGNELTPGPGNNSFIDRPSSCTNSAGATALTISAPSACVKGGGGTTPVARTDAAAAGSTTSSIISDNAIVADDTGRIVTGNNIPLNSSVGTVTDNGPVTLTQNSGSVFTGSFQLVDSNGNPVTPTATVSGVTLSAEAAPGATTSTTTVDPLYDATDPTPGGGDTGSVLISPFIKPGTTTSTFYNHYSWLRTMEDLFNVSSAASSTTNNPTYLTDAKSASYTVAGGLDGLGHLGYAAQSGLTPFGSDVFNNPAGNTPNPTGSPTASLPESPLALGLPIVGLLMAGTYLVFRRRRSTGIPA